MLLHFRAHILFGHIRRVRIRRRSDDLFEELVLLHFRRQSIGLLPRDAARHHFEGEAQRVSGS